MDFAILAFDGPDPARRAAARAVHLGVIRAWAGDGRLVFAAPLLAPDGSPSGSIMLLRGEASIAAEYLAAEPFSRDAVWEKIEIIPFRIAALPYRPLPGAADAPAAARTHTVIVAHDGTDEGALDRRLEVREPHFARVKPMAADGTLAVGGAILDGPDGAMVGSIAVVARDSDDAAQAWMADDPYVTCGVWRDITLHATRIAPLPYRPLPGARE